MIVKHNFLKPEVCSVLIDLFNHYKDEHNVEYNGRKVLALTLVKDNTFKRILELYQKSFSGKLINAQIVYWPEGESHGWHDDTIHYDYTTICNLNDNYEGGRTQVLLDQIEPCVGKCIGFPAHYPHKVSELKKGKRYVLLVWFKNN